MRKLSICRYFKFGKKVDQRASSNENDILNMKAEDKIKDESLKNDNIEQTDKNEETAASEGQETVELDPLEEKEIQIKELNDKYLRLYSEFDNYRKRTQKERIDLIQTGGEDVFKLLLPIIDDFERAQKSMDEKSDFETLKEGVDLIYNKLVSSLASKGLKQMPSAVGEKFDSDVQEAITQIPAPSEDMKGKVIDEVEKGYLLKEKVIRYAKVVVGQ
jgi:molecular chaperone GrpE